MTETERWVNAACDGIVKRGMVRVYRDLYKDLRHGLPCGEACRLIEQGLRLSRTAYLPEGGLRCWQTIGDRARAISALVRLARWADRQPWWQGVVLSGQIDGVV